MGNLRRTKRSFGGAGTGWLIALLCPPPPTPYGIQPLPTVIVTTLFKVVILLYRLASLHYRDEGKIR